MFQEFLQQELAKVRQLLGEAFAGERYDEGARLFARTTTCDDFAEFVTLPAYEMIDDWRGPHLRV